MTGTRFRWYVYAPLLLVAVLLLFPPVRFRFADAGLRWLYILAVSFVGAFCMTPLCGRVARRFGIIDHPAQRKSHLTATPLLGGGAVFFGFLLAIALNGMCNRPVRGILAGAAILFIVGILDDMKDISATVKLAVQFLAAFLVMHAGVMLHVVPVQFGLAAWGANTILTVLWIIGITNAMNFFDGMDGLAAGLGAMIAFFLGMVAHQTGQPYLGWIAVAMMGSCLGFLPHNLKGNGRASIFLGDAGSTTIGFVLACIAIYGNWAAGNPVVALVSPLLIFWVLIFDMVYITVDRIATGKVVNIRQWLEYVGKDHLHHRLARVVGSNKKSVLFIYLLSGCLGISALVLRHSGPYEALLVVMQAIILVGLISILERYGRNGVAEKNPSAPGALNIPD